MGGGYYPLDGALYVLMESRGIYGGNQSMERRAVAHMAAVSGMLNGACDTADTGPPVFYDDNRQGENGTEQIPFLLFFSKYSTFSL